MSIERSQKSVGRAVPTSQKRGSGHYFDIKKGLDLPISGRPELVVEEGAKVGTVAVSGPDFIGLKPAMAVEVGDKVKLGQPLFADKQLPGVVHTSPAAGAVSAINRGEKRALQSVVIEIEGSEELSFSSYTTDQLGDLSRDKVVESLLESGLWTALRTRPYGKVPSPEARPHSIFVNAMDSNPLAAPPRLAIEGREFDFRNGLTAVSKLSDGALYLCQPTGDPLPGAELDAVTPAVFDGPHPACLPGTHIHLIDPVSPTKTVWYLAAQDVLAIGALFATGKLNTERLVSLAGTMVERPRVLRTRMGACVAELVAGQLKDPQEVGSEARVISGSVLYGRQSEAPLCYLGRHHLQISAIEEDPKREFLEWHHPGIDRFSVTRLFISKFLRIKKFPFTTCAHGSARAMVPVGSYEQVLPHDMMPTFLLRALIVGDTDQAQDLGCLELEEEDIALCTFACPAKYDYGPILRKNLTMIENDG